ncbi:MAG TPA: PIG-L family deacetylase [Candidatus Dormibacteraeota bacterium]|nr:PIG-L family deacetylase [Candidatus Dormibacteraeota bacterium]
MASSEPAEAGPPTPTLPTLELFEYVPERALVVVAHPDDCDFLAASVLSAWSRQGCQGAVCLVTDGDAGSDDPTIPAGELSRVRLAEQRLASQHLGVSEVRCLGYPDGVLQNTLAVRRDLVRVIRELRPEAVITMDPTNRWFGRGYLNHPDHRAAGDAALDAIFPSARDARAFPELLREEGLQPHKVRFVFVGASSDSDIAIPLQPIDLENKMAALGEHHSQFDASDMREGMERGAREVGRRCGVELAECYRFFDLVPNPSQRAYRREIQKDAATLQAELLPEPPEPATDWG